MHEKHRLLLWLKSPLGRWCIWWKKNGPLISGEVELHLCMAIGIFNRVRGRMAQLGKVRPAAQQLGHKLAPVVCLYIRAKEIQVAPTKTKFTFNGIGRGEWISWKHIYSLQQHFPFFGCFQMEFFFPFCMLSLSSAPFRKHDCWPLSFYTRKLQYTSLLSNYTAHLLFTKF